MTVWVVGEYKSGADLQGIVWEIDGVYSSEEKAIAACRTEDYFIGLMNVDQPGPKESVWWPGCYYPKLQEKPSDD